MRDWTKAFVLCGALVSMMACNPETTNESSSDLDTLVDQRIAQNGKQDGAAVKLEAVEYPNGEGFSWVIFASQEAASPVRTLLGQFFGEDPSLPQELNTSHVQCKTTDFCYLLLQEKPTIYEDRISFGTPDSVKGAARLLAKELAYAVSSGVEGARETEDGYELGALSCETFFGDASDTLDNVEILCTLSIASTEPVFDGLFYSEEFAIPDISPGAATLSASGRTNSPLLDVLSFMDSNGSFPIKADQNMGCESASLCSINFSLADKPTVEMEDGEAARATFFDERGPADALYSAMAQMYMAGGLGVEYRGKDGYKLGKLWCSGVYEDAQFSEVVAVECQIESLSVAPSYGLSISEEFGIPDIDPGTKTIVGVKGRSTGALQTLFNGAGGVVLGQIKQEALWCTNGSGATCGMRIPSTDVLDAKLDEGSNLVYLKFNSNNEDASINVAQALGEALYNEINDGGNLVVSTMRTLENGIKVTELRLGNLACWDDSEGQFTCELGE